MTVWRVPEGLASPPLLLVAASASHAKVEPSTGRASGAANNRDVTDPAETSAKCPCWKMLKPRYQHPLPHLRHVTSWAMLAMPRVGPSW